MRRGIGGARTTAARGVRARRTAMLVAAAFALAPAVAHAQGGGASATPVVGSGSFGSAPELESGTTYGDSVRPGEILYYAVPLQAGQSIRASIQLEDENPADDAVVAFSAYDPLRRFIADTNAVVPPDGAADLTTEPAAAVSATGADDAAGPGVWYVAVVATTPGQTESRFELPFTLDVEVTGTAAPSATPSASPSPTPTATPAADDGGDDGAPSLGLVGGVGAVGLVLGGLGGVRLRRR